MLSGLGPQVCIGGSTVASASAGWLVEMAKCLLRLPIPQSSLKDSGLQPPPQFY